MSFIFIGLNDKVKCNLCPPRLNHTIKFYHIFATTDIYPITVEPKVISFWCKSILPVELELTGYPTKKESSIQVVR